MIDLRKFCCTGIGRASLRQPFSRGEFTYATNGLICIRVARRADVPEQEAPDVTKLAWGYAGRFVPLPAFAVPPIETENCEVCDGRGFEHECPDCSCSCAWCDGSGKRSNYEGMSIDLQGTPFNLELVLLLRALPVIEIAEVPDEPTPFRFEGGDGLVMPLRTRSKEHIETAVEHRNGPAIHPESLA